MIRGVAWALLLLTLAVTTGAAQGRPPTRVYSAAQIQALVRDIRADLNTYWQKQITNYRPPVDVVMVQVPAATDCGTITEPNAGYCATTHKIYWDLSLLQEQIQIGDFAVVFVLAHEWGHLAQAQLGFRDTAAGLLTIQRELQADCLAGSFANDAMKRGVLEEGDEDEATLALRRAGDDFDTPWFDIDAHGTPGQRIDAFTYGFQGRSCLSDVFFSFLKALGVDPARAPQTPAPSRGTLEDLLPAEVGRFTLTSIKHTQISGAADGVTGKYRTADNQEVEFTVFALPTAKDAEDIQREVVGKVKGVGFTEVKSVDLVNRNQQHLGRLTVLQGKLESVVWSNQRVMAHFFGPLNVTFELYEALPF